MKKPIRNIFAFICVAVLICVVSCAAAYKANSLDKSNSKIKNETPLKPIQEVIVPPDERAKAIEQNKVIWSPQERFPDKKSMREKIEIRVIEPEQ
jgi:hypothetical protein